MTGDPPVIVPDPVFVSDERLNNMVTELIEAQTLSVAQLTRKQLVDAICQAIKAGDFVRMVCSSPESQAVVYIPYYREERLNSRIKTLERALQEHGIAPPCESAECSCSG